MPIIPVADLRAHLNLDHEADDALLTQQLDAAEEYVSYAVGSPMMPSLDQPIAPTIRQAVLMLAAFWYETREAALPGVPYAVPFGVSDLLQSHQRWVV